MADVLFLLLQPGRKGKRRLQPFSAVHAAGGVKKPVWMTRRYEEPPLARTTYIINISPVQRDPEYDIGKALGHSSPATTSKIYTHLLDPLWDES